MNYKLTLATSEAVGVKITAKEIVTTYGEDFDAPRGDFTATVVDDQIEVIILDVARGDVRALIEDLDRDFDEDIIVVSVSENDPAAGGWFRIDIDEEDE